MTNRKRSFSNFQFGNRKNNCFSVDKNNLDFGLVALCSAVTNFIVKNKRTKRTPAWQKITSVVISGAWLCLLTDKSMTSEEKDFILTKLKEHNFIFNNKTYDWGKKGYRKDFKSSYLALGPWSRHTKLRNVKNSYGLLTITTPNTI
jgi:hypothetical protein